MIQSGYTKLFGSIVASTVWNEDNPTRIVWITLLALSDRDGYVAGSMPGLATLARVSVEECRRALDRLQQADEYSRSPEYDGRRVEAVDGGWFILNRAKYRDLCWEEDKAERHRLANRRYYQNQKTRAATNSDINSDNGNPNQVESDHPGDKKESESKKPTTTKQSPSENPSSKSPKRTNRRRAAMLAGYPQTVSNVVNQVLAIWPVKQANGEPIRPDVAALASRADEILRDNEDASAELLINAAERYVSETRKFYKAPQYFFGPGNGDAPPWIAYARMVVHQASKSQEAEAVYS
jgi:hypothetical protein